MPAHFLIEAAPTQVSGEDIRKEPINRLKPRELFKQYRNAFGFGGLKNTLYVRHLVIFLNIIFLKKIIHHLMKSTS